MSETENYYQYKIKISPQDLNPNNIGQNYIVNVLDGSALIGNKQKNVGINGFFGYRSRWEEHPERDEAWKQAEMGRIGEERFRREYGCEFLVYDETLINSIKLSELLGREPVEKMGQVRWYKKPTGNNLYLISLDPSLGTGGDFSAIQVFELPSMVQCAEWQHNITPIQGQIKILRDILNYIQEQIS